MKKHFGKKLAISLILSNAGRVLLYNKLTMETNINVNPFGETIVKCPVCSRKFHKDNLAGHLKYESQNLKVDETPSKSKSVEIKKSDSNSVRNFVEHSAIKEQDKEAESA